MIHFHHNNTLPTPEYKNCRFNGWTGSNGNTPETTVTIPADNTADKEYTANFNCSNYIMTFNANGGSVNPTTLNVVPTNAIGTLPTTSKYGYSFGGWYLDNNTFQNEVTTSYVPSENKTIYAKWIKTVNAMVFEDTDLYMVVNNTKQINITNASLIEEAYTFTSSNTSIATVSSTGLITATGAGDATITITGSTSGETKQVNVHVSSDDNIVLFDPTSPAIKNYLFNQ